MRNKRKLNLVTTWIDSFFVWIMNKKKIATAMHEKTKIKEIELILRPWN